MRGSVAVAVVGVAALLVLPVSGSPGVVRQSAGGAERVAAEPAGQSPVDLRSGLRAPLPALEFDYPDRVELTLHYKRRDGCAVRHPEEAVVGLPPAGVAGLTVDGHRYRLVEVHWHTPSEHRLAGRGFAVEQHLVHVDAHDRHLVVAVLVAVGGGSPAGSELGRIFADLPEECGPDVAVSDVDLGAVLPGARTSYRYPGSLTTHPYDGGVSWIVLSEPVTATAGSLAPLLVTFPEGNAREPQPIGDRVVRTDRP